MMYDVCVSSTRKTASESGQKWKLPYQWILISLASESFSATMLLFGFKVQSESRS
jgi:hypothetical protein